MALCTECVRQDKTQIFNDRHTFLSMPTFTGSDRFLSLSPLPPPPSSSSLLCDAIFGNSVCHLLFHFLALLSDDVSFGFGLGQTERAREGKYAHFRLMPSPNETAKIVCMKSSFFVIFFFGHDIRVRGERKGANADDNWKINVKSGPKWIAYLYHFLSTYETPPMAPNNKLSKHSPKKFTNTTDGNRNAIDDI